jgi:hypothetical protein
MDTTPLQLPTLRRRDWLAVALLAASPLVRAASRTPIQVWKEATCGCCGDWIKHLEANGFQVQVHDGGNTAMRAKLGVANQYASCHTAVVEGYAIEGHVPAREVRRLLRERPQAVGLAVPGMPIGSPGMDGPAYGGRRDAYAVLLLQRDGSSHVYQAYR